MKYEKHQIAAICKTSKTYLKDIANQTKYTEGYVYHILQQHQLRISDEAKNAVWKVATEYAQEIQDRLSSINLIQE